MARIRPLLAAEREAWLAMRAELWPDSAAEHAGEVATYFLDGCIAGLPHHVLVAEVEDRSELVGFVEVSLKAADGAGSGPLGYIEGWWVAPKRRRAGIGRALIREAERWCAGQGCTRVGSDTTGAYARESVPAHIACGFVADRVEVDHGGVRFVKSIG